MSTSIELQTEVRRETGKGPARQLRKRGMIPAVFYGPESEPTPLSISPKRLLKALEGPHGKNTLLKLAMEQGERLALVKEIDVDPVTYDPVHVDFYHVDPEREVEVDVPFKTKGRSVGVQKGGTLHVTLRSLPVRAKPEQIPAVIEVDVTKLEVNDIVRVQDLSLPEGVEVLRAGHRTLVTVMSEERKRGAAEAVGEAEVAPTETEEGEAAAASKAAPKG